MLKYEKIIEILSVQQKIRLLCDISVLANPEYTKLGIPSLNIVDFEDECVGYPSPQAMANSWNTELIRDAAVDAAEEIAAKLKGNTCGFKSTSCADQLAIAVSK